MSGSWFPTIAAMVATAVGLVMLWPLRATGRRAPFIVMVVAVGVAGSALYYLVGTPEAAAPTARTGEPASLREGVVELQRALERDPQRADGWALLGRSQQALGNLAEANRAFARAVQLAPDEPELLVEAAQTRAQADPAKQFDDTALQWLRHAQRLAPGSERAGWLIGIAQRQRGQDAEAAATWEALLPRLDPGAATALREQIAIAREKAGLPAAAAPSAAATAAPALTVTVALDPAFAARARLRDDASIFVIARIPGGPPMPVAVEKHRLADLPLRVTLDDADSPMPTQPLSALKEVEVFARLSASGQANRQEGDIDSPAVRVPLPRAEPVPLLIAGP
ncbi:tetratricopeptide repeat protein [Stenotrophomonas sp. 364]|uniref:tetratricopeptide repeat protein n=1 Tax=Stenotrophomonas sp. 364 TaxID=2691571 RepID=UPI001315BFD7|nr:tetratricopeptide repeat protein [Stenotrophomonas sp. 364]QHB71964.1 tetratricopeptide repeat protein [Stenotrophomonas sp. 364]